MAYKTPDQTPDTPRLTAELDDSSDNPADWTLLPPTVQITGDVHKDIRTAVEAAIADEPNSADELCLIDARDSEEHHVALLTANYNEMPVSDDNGELLGWVAPYRAREKFDAALREHLPEGISFEAKNNFATTFYEGY